MQKKCLKLREKGQDLADILGRTDVDFENVYFLDFLLDSKFPDFQVPRFPDFQKSGLGRVKPGLGWAWARPGPGLG